MSSPPRQVPEIEPVAALRPQPSRSRAGLHASALIFLALASAPACATTQPTSETPADYAANAKKAYDEAVESYLDHDWELAREQLDAVKRNYAYSRYARLAQLRLGDLEYAQQSYAEAITEYKNFVHDYPNDPEVEYARYRIASAQYVSAGSSILLPPLEERDLNSVRDAFTSLRTFLADFPGNQRERELRYMLEVVTGLLVRHELYVARFYLNQDEFGAAIARSQYALTTYSASGLEPEAIVLLGETYLKMKERAKARAAFEQVLTEYPDSAFCVPARRFLAQMGDAPAPSAAAPKPVSAQAPLP